MPEVGAYQLKTHLSAYLKRVKKGERFLITLHGQPAAELREVPARDPEAIRKAIAGLRALRTAVRPGKDRAGDLVRAGRKH